MFYSGPHERPQTPDPIVRAEIVASDWVPPADTSELLTRAFPKGAPDTWARFFAGERVEDEDRARIRTALDAHKQTPGESFGRSEELTRIKNRIENDLNAYAWLDTDHRSVVGMTAEQLAPAVSSRAALDLQLRSIKILLEQNAGSESVRVRYANDMHLLWMLADANVNAPASFPDRYKYLLPVATVERIDAMREYIARQANQSRQAEEANRLRQIEEKEREKIERMAAVESLTFDGLLDMLFPRDGGASILESFRRRTWQETHLGALVDLTASPYPARRRALERLVEIGAGLGIAIPSLDEIEAAHVAKWQAEEESQQKELADRINALDAAPYASLCEEVNRLNLAPPEIIGVLPGVRDTHRVTQIRQFFIERAGAETDPLRKRVCEVMARKVLERNISVSGAAWQGLG
jgi:hypothetical protein